MNKISVRIVLVILLLSLVTLVYAQEKPITFGVKAGMNLSNMFGDTDNPESKIGYQIGFTFDYALSNDFFIQTGVEFTNKGYVEKSDLIIEDGIEVYNPKITLNANYLQLPIHIGYTAYKSDNLNISLATGPYLALGVGGKTKMTGEANIPDYYYVGSFSSKVNTFKAGLLKEFDMGFGANIAAEIKKIEFRIGYDFGLINIYAPVEDEKAKIKNQNLYLSLGYKF